jgi:hypothetical protein
MLFEISIKPHKRCNFNFVLHPDLGIAPLSLSKRSFVKEKLGTWRELSLKPFVKLKWDARGGALKLLHQPLQTQPDSGYELR